MKHDQFSEPGSSSENLEQGKEGLIQIGDTLVYNEEISTEVQQSGDMKSALQAMKDKYGVGPFIVVKIGYGGKVTIKKIDGSVFNNGREQVSMPPDWFVRKDQE